MSSKLIPAQPIQPYRALTCCTIFIFTFTFIVGSYTFSLLSNFREYDLAYQIGCFLQLLNAPTEHHTTIFNIKPFAHWQSEFQKNAIASYLFGLLLSIAISIPLFFSILFKQKTQFIRGRRLTDKPRQFNYFLRKKEGKPDGIFIHPQIQIQKRRETEHLLMLAQPGGGKTQIFNPIAQQAIRRNDRVLIFDFKGGITESTSENVAIIAPWDDRSLAIDIAKDLRNKGDARAFSEAVILTSKDPMWANGARQFLVAFIVYLQQTKPLLWTWRDLSELLSTDYENLKKLVETYNPEGTPAVEEASKTLTSLRINLSSYMAPVFDLADAWGSTPSEKRISIRDWIENPNHQHKTLILQGNEEYPSLIKALLQTVIRTTHQTVNTPRVKETDNRIWLFLDEFLQAGKIDYVISLLEVGRSKGVRVFLATQDYHRICEVYGQESAAAMLGSIGTIIFGKTTGKSATLNAQHIGKTELLRPKISASGHALIRKRANINAEQIRDEIDVMRPEEFGDLGQVRRLLNFYSRAVIFTGHQLVCMADWPRKIYPKIRPAHIPAAWTQPTFKKSQNNNQEEHLPSQNRTNKSKLNTTDLEQLELLEE